MKKENLTSGIPAGILKGCVDFYISISTKIPNTLSERGFFPNQLKLSELTSILKKEGELNKENYHLVSVLSQASKIFERIDFKQIKLFFESKFLPLLTGFCQNHNTENAILTRIKKGK